MKWRKLGKIFDPTRFTLPHQCKQFAQAPQALVFDDFVRIYFTTRQPDDGDKYLGHVAYVDVKKDMCTIIGVSQHTVIELGKLGTFDEHGIFPMNVVRHGDLIHGYTSGVNRRVSVAADGAIGLAISRDNGHTFQRLGDGPVVAASYNIPCLAVDPFVLIADGTFHMWYVYGVGWKNLVEGAAPDRIYKIGHATSADGIQWVKEDGKQILPDRLGSDECQALPTVIDIDGAYHMFFCYRQSSDFRKNRDRSYRIGHAVSGDLQTWKRDDENFAIDVTEGEWDSDMMCYPHVFRCDGKVYMLYNGNEFGRLGFGIAVLE